MPFSLFDESLESRVTLETESTPLPDDLPFRLLMIGDWGGSSDYSAKALSARKTIEIDRDEFDDVIRKITPEVKLKFDEAGDSILRLTFESLDDFNPDNIFQRLSLFSDLRNIRHKLKKADTFNEAAREVRSWYANSVDEDKSQDEENISASPSESFESLNLLDQILDSKQDSVSVKQKTPKSSLSEFIGNIIASHIVKTDFEEQSKLLAIVDEVISDLMRRILHHKDFQELESAWRGLYFLVRKVETDNKLKIALVQLKKDELLDNLNTVNSLSDSQFYKWLAKDAAIITNSNNPWAVVCANYKFNPTVEDTAALIRIAKIAKSVDCPFISHIGTDLFGISSFTHSISDCTWEISPESSEYKLWSALRSMPESSYLGLALPKFIGRFPYGSDTEPTEAFSFEEFKNEPQHDEYLWLNPCFAYAYAFAKEFSLNEWNINQNISFDIENLPLHLHKSEGITKTKSCVEIEMKESIYNLVVQEGIMILISFRDADSVRLSALRSVSRESSALKGKWENT